MVHISGKLLLDFDHKLVVKHVALAYREHFLLTHKLGVEAFKLIKQNLILLLDVGSIGRHHKEQHSITLDMTEETQSEPLALACSLNDTGNVGHDKRAIITVAHDTELRLHRSKRIVGNLGARGGDR